MGSVVPGSQSIYTSAVPVRPAARPSPERPFSLKWALLSAGVFLVSQLLLGYLVADLVQGTRASLHTRFLTEAILNLSSYFLGGIVVGLISPGIRINEPAVGAFACVAAMFVVTVFTPLSFVSFSCRGV